MSSSTMTHKEAALKRLGLAPGQEVVREVLWKLDGDLVDEAEALANQVPVGIDIYVTRALQFYNKRVRIQIRKAEKLDLLGSSKTSRTPTGSAKKAATKKDGAAAKTE